MIRAKILPLLLSGLLAMSPTAMAQTDVAEMAVKRYFLLAVHQRCGLMAEATARALAAGYVQARNTVLRNGHSMEQLKPWLAKARTAAAVVACDDAGVANEAQVARKGFHTFRSQFHLDLPGSRADWKASRAHADDTQWRLVQYRNMSGGDAALGLYGTLDRYSFAVMAQFKDGAKPYSARLLVRDPARLRAGLINPAAYDIDRRMPMGLSEAGTQSFMARGMSHTMTRLTPAVATNAAGFTLTGNYVGKEDAAEAVRFDFPSAAFPAMAKLDPREDVVVVFECDDGPRYVRFEVGDFITGLTWIGLPV